LSSSIDLFRKCRDLPFGLSPLFSSSFLLYTSSPDSSQLQASNQAQTVSPQASRLNLTLKGNEARYQAAVRERKASIENIGHSAAACVCVSASSIADC
jgi:hypothetical protein